jgi:alkylhydroperoxidase family enzyme
MNKHVHIVLLSLFLLGGCTTHKKLQQSAEESNPLPGGGKEWTAKVDQSVPSLIRPPDKIHWLSRILLNRAEKEFGKELLPGRILTWSNDLSVASGFLEKYIEKGAAKILGPRLIYLLRMQVSFYVSCPFAIDVNSYKYKEHRITEEEIQGLQGKKDLSTIASLTEREVTALRYAIALSKTPVRFESLLLEDLRRLFSQEEIAAVASLSAKVNYWARLIEAWRIKPVGYTADPVLDIEKYNTFFKE